MPVTALIVRAPEAERLVSELRRRHDPSATQGVPAHVTVLVPFKDPTQLSTADELTLERLFLAQPAFTFTLVGIGRWSKTAFLLPSPAHRFVTLTNEVVRAFPSYLPYDGMHEEVVPHLTVADGSTEGAESAELELTELLRAHGPIKASCEEVELIENSSGAWKVMRVFRLASSDA